MYDTADFMVHGQVQLADGSAPQQLVLIERVCKGKVQTGGFADSKGRFSFNLGNLNRALTGPGGISDTKSNNQLAANMITVDDLKSCTATAGLPGHSAKAVQLNPSIVETNASIGTIVLTPIGSGPSPAKSAGDADAPKNARKAFEKGLDLASKAKWKEAADSFRNATSAYPTYASAWLSLGILQEGSGDVSGALESYAQAEKADPKFAPPYLQAAAVAAMKGNWDEVVAQSAKAIELRPDTYPRAYLLNALGNLNSRKVAEAEKSALEGLKLDTDRSFPDLEYVLGLALANKRDNPGALEHFQKYLEIAPKGQNADNARQQLERLRAAK